MLPAAAGWCETEGTVTNSERRVQRVRKALDPPGERPRRPRDHPASSPAASATTGPTTRAEAVWDELRSLSPMHAGMSYRRLEELGGIQWPCYHEDPLEPPYLHGRLWAEDPAERGRPAPFSVVRGRAAGRPARRRVPAAAHHRPPARLLQHRRAVGGLRVAAAAGETVDLSPADAAALGIVDGELVRVVSRRGSVEAPVARRPRAAAGPRVHDPALPRRGRHQPAHDRGHGTPGRAPPSSRPPPCGSRSSTSLPRAATDADRRAWTCTSSMPGRRAEEQDAVDALLGLLGRRASVGGERPRRRIGHVRLRRTDGPASLRHAAAGPARRQRPRRLDQPGRASTRSAGGSQVPPAEVYGVATLLRPVLLRAPAAPGAARLHRPGLRHTAPASWWPASEPRAPCHRRRGDVARQPLPRAVRAGAGGAGGRGGAPPRAEVLAPASAADLAGAAGRTARPRRAAGRASVPQRGDPALRAAAPGRRGRPGSLERLPRPRRLRGAAAGRRARARRGDRRGAEASKLAGRGGAAFPTGRKWDGRGRPARPPPRARRATPTSPSRARSRTGCCMEGDPFAVIEAMTIAGFATGCRARLPLPAGRVPARPRSGWSTPSRRPARRACSAPDVDGHGFAFDIEIRRGAGAYICGEETAIFNSIEGYRGEPRNKPPFPVEVGLFGRPTLVNNVETLVNVLPILTMGGAGLRGDRHRRLDGAEAVLRVRRVERPGVYEVPFGATLRELIDLAGGVPDGHDAAGGAARRGGRRVRSARTSSTCRSPSRARAPRGVTLGSGCRHGARRDGSTSCRFLLRVAAFFRDESCGQCVPCRVGTVRQEEILRPAGGRTGRDPAGRPGAARRRRPR